MYLLALLLLYTAFTSVQTAQDTIENNWSDWSSSEEWDEKKVESNKNPVGTPAPIMVIRPPPPPPPPVKPAVIINPKPEVDSGETIYYSGEEYEYVSGEYPEVVVGNGGNGESWSYIDVAPPAAVPPPQVAVAPPLVTVAPPPRQRQPVQVQREDSVEETDQTGPAIPIKIPFIPISGPNVQVGTILKPGGFNGMKPVKKPKQIQSRPYESWAESHLSMAPKPKNLNGPMTILQ